MEQFDLVIENMYRNESLRNKMTTFQTLIHTHIILPICKMTLVNLFKYIYIYIYIYSNINKIIHNYNTTLSIINISLLLVICFELTLYNLKIISII